MADTQDLATHMQYAYDSVSDDGDWLYSSEPHLFSGQAIPLRPNTTARVLVFPGYFNPPHEGHYGFLQYCFEDSKQDLALAAAIIFPFDEQELNAKYDSSSEVVLTKKQRSKTWKNHVDTMKKPFLVFDQPFDKFEQHLSTLKSSLKEHNINLKFVELIDPRTDLAVGCFSTVFEFDILLSSNCGRWPATAYDQTTLLRKTGFSKWEAVRQIDDMAAVVRCKSEAHQVYFVWYSFSFFVFPHAESIGPGLRKTIQESQDKEDMLKRFKDSDAAALCPELLVEIVVEDRKAKGTWAEA